MSSESSTVTILFETHATSFDNERELSSGHYDVALSPRGVREARELGKRYHNRELKGVFCSDLHRSYRTAELAFEDRPIPLVRDPRLRECDYGDLTRHPKREVTAARLAHVWQPFPNGESYRQASERVRSFLLDLRKSYPGETILIVGHHATQCSLEHWIRRVPLERVLTAPWKWKPGWVYHLHCIVDSSQA